MLILAACGSSATAVPAAPVATKAPAAPAAPAAVAAPAVSPALAAYAAKYAGGVGAIYVGDLNQLVGPAPTKGQGDAEGNVPLDALQRHLYVYESDYYKSLLVKAKLTNPTPLVSTGQSIKIQHVCIARALLPCVQMANYFGPNLLARTNGQLKLEISSYPELGLSGPDQLSLVADGTVAMSDIYSGFVSGAFPAIEIQNLWGLYPNRETEYRATVAIAGDLENLISGVTGGAKIINYNWFAGADQFLFCNKPLRTLADYKALKTRSHGSAMTDWIVGMGGEAQFVAFGDVYVALERGILDCGVSGGDPAYGQRWYEVTKTLNGPLFSFFTINNVMNKGVWDKLPPDIQQIMIEEGAKSELEALRIAAIQNEVGILKNTTAGMEFVEFSPELRARSNATVVERLVPNWVKRAGGADTPIIKIFNEKIGPLVGLHVEANGTVVKVPVTAK
jgi:TRAP-type C4-dicarboxylate transport system substrate-binding protein